MDVGVKVAWFSPVPPSTSGIAAYSAELLPLLRSRGIQLETFSDENAQDFVWAQRRRPFDLTVFQMGNAACHDYMWAYLFRYPGLVVLHDAQLHQARALFLTRRWVPRRADYLEEFHANHPEAPRDIGELVAAGLGGTLYQHWPMVRLVIESARMTVVHNARVAADLREKYPRARIESIEMGVSDPLAVAAGSEDAPPAPSVRMKHDIPADAIVLAAFGGVTPEKRIPRVLRAMSSIAERHPRLHCMLVGSPAPYYDVMADARALGIADRVHVTGFVADEELPRYLQAADICACLRWPTNRETSASWLRCIAAGRVTVITELAHLADVPTMDPRGWRVLKAAREAEEPVAISIDMLDEDHSLQLALERLVTDSPLRERLGQAARRLWERHHQMEPMVAAYEQLIASAARIPAPELRMPAHIGNDGSATLRSLAGDLGVTDRIAEIY